jgi:adenylylsulfate kinase-like enzyme
MVVWLTGISGAGKTTIAESILAVLKPLMPGLILVDGDVVRELFGAGLGFDENSRVIQIGRIQRLAMFLARQEVRVIVTALYANPDLLRWNRSNLPGYFEVYVNTPLATAEGRDTKGLYSKARSGDLLNVVGIDIPWHEPQNPDMIVNSVGTTPAELAWKIIEAVPQLKSLMENETVRRSIN